MPDDHLISVKELCIHHHIQIDFIQSLYDHGLIELTTVEDQILIPFSQLGEVEKMIRLHHELDVNIEGIDVIRHLLIRLEEAQDEISKLQNKLKFYLDTEEQENE